MQLSLENYNDIGGYLRDSRESLGLKLDDIAYVLNIRARYLVAIEAGRFSELPGSIYTKGYLQSYAAYLGLDKEVVGAAFERMGGGKSSRIFYLSPTRVDHLPDKQVVVLSVCLLVVIYAFWQHFMVIHKNYDNEVRELPQRAVSMEKKADTQKPVKSKPVAPVYAQGCLNPQWDKLYPPCYYFVQQRAVRLNLIKLYQSPVFKDK